MNQILHVILNGFSGRICKRIIEETLQPFTVGSCVSIIRREQEAPTLNALEHLRHDPRDMDTMDWNTIRPLDEKVIYSMRECEAIFLHMMGRREWTGRLYSYDDRKRQYLMFLRYWNHIIDEKKINLFLSTTLPHRTRTHLIYRLCKAKGVTTIFPYHAGHMESDFLLVEDIVDFSPELKKKIQELQSHYSDSNTDPVELPERYEKYVESQLSAGHNLPRYWYTGMAFMPSPTLGKFGQAVQLLQKEYLLFFKQVHASISARCRLAFWVYRIRYAYRKIRARRIFRFYDSHAIEPDFSKTYVYLPLHLQPECSTVPMSGAYADQILMAQMLSEVLPDNVCIYVKEHPSQQRVYPDGMNRSIAFYEDLMRCSRVRLIKRTANTYRLTDGAIAVATGIGTAGAEGLFRRKPFLMFGHWSYQYAPGVFPIHTVEDCKRAVDVIISGGGKPMLRDLRIFLRALADVSIQGVLDERWGRHRPEDEAHSIKVFSRALIDRIQQRFPACASSDTQCACSQPSCYFAS